MSFFTWQINIYTQTSVSGNSSVFTKYFSTFAFLHKVENFKISKFKKLAEMIFYEFFKTSHFVRFDCKLNLRIFMKKLDEFIINNYKLLILNIILSLYECFLQIYKKVGIYTRISISGTSLKFSLRLFTFTINFH